MKYDRTTHIEDTHMVELTVDDVREFLLSRPGLPLGPETTIEVYVRVPSGGDHSGMNLDIDKDCPVVVRWRTSAVEKGGNDG
jgi:hypothetical protein